MNEINRIWQRYIDHKCIDVTTLQCTMQRVIGFTGGGAGSEGERVYWTTFV